MCTNNRVCGSRTTFVDSQVEISANFTNANQLCVYQVIFHEFDPLNVIYDLTFNVQTLKNVQVEVFSKVERNKTNKYFPEVTITDLTTYVQNIANKED